MTISYLHRLNNDPEIRPLFGPKCAPVGGQPCVLSLFDGNEKELSNELFFFPEI